MNFFAWCMSLTSLVWGVLFLATRLTLLVEGHSLASDLDQQNQALRANCMRSNFRDALGTKAHICDDAFREVAAWPVSRAVDHVWKHTHLCGAPCHEVATALISNPLNLVLLVCALAVLPYVSALLSRAAQHANTFNSSDFASLEGGQSRSYKSKFT
jgi:hypothetical protein